MKKLCRIVVLDLLIDEEKCSRCRDCIAYCPMDVLADRGDGVPVVAAKERCIACIGCMALCPSSAITVVTDWACGPEAPEGG
ncbi:MAG: 4Fe-4S dicluster domain-containing protein [Crenarchaeota archaeon]|nr:4Fe-4S dicluster domain-containing protein [Thermoproteota archaeon]